MTCPFCNYEGPSEIRHDWDDAYSIEPISPVTPGHLLVISKKHQERAGENPTSTGKLFARAAELAVEVGDCNLIQSNGSAATQTVRHIHVHVIPRKEGDGLHLPWTLSPRLQTILEHLGPTYHYAGVGGTCYECPFASVPLQQSGHAAEWDSISNDPTEAWFRCSLPGRDPDVVAWGEDAPCTQEEWVDAALAYLAGAS